MRYVWPENTQFAKVVLEVEQEACSLCQRRLHVCDHRFHPILSLLGPLRLDAHKDKEGPSKAGQLIGYKDAEPPPEEQEAIRRRKFMRQARSTKRRPALLADLERRYRAAS